MDPRRERKSVRGRARPARNPGRYLERTELRVGMKLIGTHVGKQFTLIVLGDPDRLVFEVRGHKFSGLSTAAKHSTGYEANGWRFWRVPDA